MLVFRVSLGSNSIVFDDFPAVISGKVIVAYETCKKENAGYQARKICVSVYKNLLHILVAQSQNFLGLVSSAAQNFVHA